MGHVLYSIGYHNHCNCTQVPIVVDSLELRYEVSKALCEDLRNGHCCLCSYMHVFGVAFKPIIINYLQVQV